MGSFILVPNNLHTIMKVLLLVALAIAAVVAEPEAEAAAPNPYFGPPYQPNCYAKPGAYYYGYPYAYYGYPHVLGKRSAEPEADAAHTVLYPYGVPSFYYGVNGHLNGHVGHLGHTGNPVGVATVSTSENIAWGAKSKREAEAEPEADAWYGHYYGHPYRGYYGYPYRYGYYWG